MNQILKVAGERLSLTPTTIIPLEGGRNNKVFLLENRWVVKIYFHHHLDNRDRLGAEFSFLSFAWNRGIRCIPQPIIQDVKHNFAVYTYIPGTKKFIIDQMSIEKALYFLTLLNTHKSYHEAQSLGLASESCLSIQQHLDTVERRIKRLESISETSNIERQALTFVNDFIVPRWMEITAEINQEYVEEDKVTEIPIEERCLSPSDFGFHNALLGNDGEFYFLDFEYAGWDDPIKLVCDFLCQPERPLPRGFHSKILQWQPVAKETKKMRLLFPLHQIKWCCILLNEFLKSGIQRRQFARITSEEYLKEEQLQKAKKYFQEAFL